MIILAQAPLELDHYIIEKNGKKVLGIACDIIQLSMEGEVAKWLRTKYRTAQSVKFDTIQTEIAKQFPSSSIDRKAVAKSIKSSRSFYGR